MSGGAAAHGHTVKHVGSRKHAGTSKHHPKAVKKTATGVKHHVHVKAKHVKHAKARGYALAPWLLPVCSLEAVAQSLRLAGQPVHDDEVAWLWELCGGRELSIGEALQAAARFGLAGCRPLVLEVSEVSETNLPSLLTDSRESRTVSDDLTLLTAILGVDAPGPHAVLATPRGWWSWGELHSPWPCAVEEAWAVSWS